MSVVPFDEELVANPARPVEQEVEVAEVGLDHVRVLRVSRVGLGLEPGLVRDPARYVAVRHVHERARLGGAAQPVQAAMALDRDRRGVMRPGSVGRTRVTCPSKTALQRVA